MGNKKLADNKRRHERIELNEPASVKTNAEVFTGTVIDASQSGAAVEFSFGRGESSAQFDIGSDIEVDSDHVDNRKGRVVRYYDKGFAVNFEGDSNGDK